MRRVIAHESVVPALRGPGFPRDASGTSAGFERARLRNEALDDALAAMAASLHIPYEPGDRAPIPGELSDDELHSNEAQHRRLGELEGRLIARAWLAARDGVHAPD